MSNHSEIPRIEFGSTGVSMNTEQAKVRFEEILRGYEREYLQEGGETDIEINIVLTLRPCDCDQMITGHDDYCPLHGDNEKIRTHHDAG